MLTDHTPTAEQGKSAVPAPPALHGRFSFASGLTIVNVGIFTGRPFYYISPTTDLRAINALKSGIFINDDTTLPNDQVNPANMLNWDVRATAAIQNARNGLYLDCPDFRRDPGVQVVQWALTEGTNQQWDFEPVKTANVPQVGNPGNTWTGYWIRNRFNNLVLTVPGIDRPGFVPANQLAVTLDLAMQPLKASQIWFALPPF